MSSETYPPDFPLDELEVGVRVANGLKRAGLTTIADVDRHSELQLMSLANFGRKSLRELRIAIGRDPDAPLFEKQEAPSPPPVTFHARDLLALTLHDRGMSYSGIGTVMGITATRVRQLATRADKRIGALLARPKGLG